MKRIFSCIAIFSVIQSWAQQPDSTILFPVEVRTVRAAETAPFAKTNLNSSQIEKLNLGQDLPFLLNGVPSVVVNADAGNGIGYTGIRIRGTDASRINVTINGIPFNDPESGGTFFVNMPDILSSTGSIQIQRGVGTSTNGGGAFGGSINLSTNENNLHRYFESNNSYGSFNSLKNNLRFGTGLFGKYFTADIRLSQISSDGYVERARSDLKSYYLTTAYQRKNSNIRLTHFSGKEKTYQAWYGVAEKDLEKNRRVNYAGSEKMGEPYDNETDNYKQDHYQLLFTQNLLPQWHFTSTIFYVKGKGYYQQYKANEAYADYNLPDATNGSATFGSTDLVRQLWLDNDFYGVIFSTQYNSPKNILSLGGSQANYLGNHYGKVTWAAHGLPASYKNWYSNNAVKNDWNLYAKWQHKISANWQIFTDAQIRSVNYNINGFRYNPAIIVNKKYSFFNPKMGLTYTSGPWVAFASYSVGNKEPNRDDFEAAQSQLPKPEKLNDWEAGLIKRNKTITIGATAFLMQYKNQLVLTGKINDVGAYTRTNINTSYRLGVELEGSATIGRLLKAAANVSFSRNKLKDFTEFIDDYDNGGQKQNVYKQADIAFSPGITGAATITILPVKNFEVNLVNKYVGDQFLDNTNNASRKLDAFFTQDVRAGYNFSKGRLKKTAIIMQVNNVFNKMYEPNGYTFSYYYNNMLNTENYYFPMAGINWMLGVNIGL